MHIQESKQDNTWRKIWIKSIEPTSYSKTNTINSNSKFWELKCQRVFRRLASEAFIIVIPYYTTLALYRVVVTWFYLSLSSTVFDSYFIKTLRWSIIPKTLQCIHSLASRFEYRKGAASFCLVYWQIRLMNTSVFCIFEVPEFLNRSHKIVVLFILFHISAIPYQ